MEIISFFNNLSSVQKIISGIIGIVEALLIMTILKENDDFIEGLVMFVSIHLFVLMIMILLFSIYLLILGIIGVLF